MAQPTGCSSDCAKDTTGGELESWRARGAACGDHSHSAPLAKCRPDPWEAGDKVLSRCTRCDQGPGQQSTETVTVNAGIVTVSRYLVLTCIAFASLQTQDETFDYVKNQFCSAISGSLVL